MKKTLYNLAFVVFSLFLGVFFLGGKAYAFSAYDQTINDREFYVTPDGGNISVEFTITGATDFSVTHVTIPVRNLSCESLTDYPKLNLHNADDDTETGNINAAAKVSDTTNVMDFTVPSFTLHSSVRAYVTIPCQDNSQFYFKAGYNITSAYVKNFDYAIKFADGSPVPGTNYCGGVVTCPAAVVDYTPAVTFNGSGGAAKINFQNPPFTGSLLTPDFSNWQVCVTIPSDHSYGGYYYEVHYGTSTLNSFTDSLQNSFGNVALTPGVGVNNECLALPKSQDLAAGSYIALAELFDSADNILAYSDTTAIKIASGTKVSYPNDLTPKDTPNCGTTDFKVGGVDFGKGACNVARFLIVPSQDALNQFASLIGYMEPKAPFSYFYAAKQTLTTIPTTSTSSIDTLTISNATSSPVHFNTTIFSGQKLTEYVPENTRALIRTVMIGALSLSFLYMVIIAGMSLFTSTPSGHLGEKGTHLK